MKTKIISIVFVALTTLFGMPAFSQITDVNPQHEVEYQEDLKIKDFRFAIAGGYAYRVGSIDKTNEQIIIDMSKELRNGYTIDADAQYFFKETWGIGLNANMASFSTSVNGSFTMPGIDGTINSYIESQRVLYVGPSFATRLESEKFLLLASIGVGPIFFMDNITINGLEFNGKQTTLGTNITLSGEYKLNNKMGLGLKLSSTGGKIDSVNLNGQNVKTVEDVSLANFTASVFLSFRTW